MASSSVDIAVRQQPERRQYVEKTEEGCRRQADAPPRLDDARASVRARWHAADRAALLRRLQLLADGDQRRLGRDVEDQHAARGLRQYPAVAGAEEGRHARRLHARQRAGAEAAARSADRRDRGDTWSAVEDSRCRTPAPARKSARSRTATGSSSTTISSRGATAWPCRYPKTKGATWPWTRHLERDAARSASGRAPSAVGEYHYPSIIQARDGTLHATYSYFVAAGDGEEGRPRAR